MSKHTPARPHLDNIAYMDLAISEAKEWVQNIVDKGVFSTPLTYEERQKVIDCWFDPRFGKDLKKIAEHLQLDETAVTVVVGSHPLVKAVEDAKHRAALYKVRADLEQMGAQIVEILQKLTRSKQAKDWDIALNHIRKYLSMINETLSERPEPGGFQVDIIFKQAGLSPEDVRKLMQEAEEEEE